MHTPKTELTISTNTMMAFGVSRLFRPWNATCSRNQLGQFAMRRGLETDTTAPQAIPPTRQPSACIHNPTSNFAHQPTIDQPTSGPASGHRGLCNPPILRCG